MLTEQEIIDAFMNKVQEHPDSTQIAAYQDLSTEELNEILDRRIAIENNIDPTYLERLAENYQQYLAATPEEKLNWQRIRPIIQS